MSYNFRNESHTVGTSEVSVYTCPSGVSSGLVFGLSVANILATDVTVDITVYDDSEATTSNLVAADTTIVAGESLVPVGGVQKLVLEPSDIIKVTCDTLVGVDVIVSVIEFD